MVKCIECSGDKPPAEFYAHPQMASGHVNVCKDCHKHRMKVRRRLNPAVQEFDRARAKDAHRKQKSAEYSRKWRAQNPQAYRAHNAVNNAVRDGKLTKLPCEFCGADRVMAHHRDYSRPLDVIWLCAKCHNRLHASFPELEGKAKRAS